MSGIKGNKAHGKRYSDEEMAIYCELAQAVGIGRAIRELGYPTHTTAMVWMHDRGVEPLDVDVLAEARKFARLYEAYDLIKIIDDSIATAQELSSKAETADDIKKCAEAVQRLVNTRLLLEGKANSITEKRETTQADLEIAELLRAEQAKQNPRVSQTPS